MCELTAQIDEFTLWARPLASNYYVLHDEKHVAYIGSGPKSHFYVSIFFPKGGGSHYSYTTEHSDLQSTFEEIVGKLQ